MKQNPNEFKLTKNQNYCNTEMTNTNIAYDIENRTSQNYISSALNSSAMEDTP